ncbi:hypothetical protein D3C73_1592240 [compost metagenome]
MNQRNAQLRRFFGQNAGRRRVDGERYLRFVFSLIDRGVSRGVDDQVGTNPAYLLTQLLWIGQIELGAPRYDQFAKCLQVMLQLG